MFTFTDNVPPIQGRTSLDTDRAQEVIDACIDNPNQWARIDKAAQVIADHNADGVCNEPECIAGDLARAGLLAPDLPEPQKHSGELVWPLADPDGWAVTATDDYVRLSDERGAIITINRKLARDLAHALLAAADYAEKGDSNA